MSAADANELGALRRIAAEARGVLDCATQDRRDEYIVEGGNALDPLREALAALVEVCAHHVHTIAGVDGVTRACCKCGATLDAEQDPTHEVDQCPAKS